MRMKILGLISGVVLLCAASYHVGQVYRSRKTASAHKQFTHSLQRLLQASNVLYHLDAGDLDRLRHQSEADLVWSIGDIAEVVDDLDEGSSDYIILPEVLDRLEGYVTKNPLKHRDTGKLLRHISGLRDKVGRDTHRNPRVQTGAAVEEERHVEEQE